MKVLFFLLGLFSASAFLTTSTTSSIIRGGSSSTETSSFALERQLRNQHRNRQQQLQLQCKQQQQQQQQQQQKQQQQYGCTFRRTTSALQATERAQEQQQQKEQKSSKPKKFNHVLAILTMPCTSMDRIANERILETVVPATADKLSIVLRCESGSAPSVASLRRYVGEVYSQLWDCVIGESSAEDGESLLPDVVVYPANLPNAAPESWITILPDLDAICSYDSFVGWMSEDATGRGERFKKSAGVGGLDEHVAAVNMERRDRKLSPVTALHVDMPQFLRDQVVFLDDDDDEGDTVKKVSNKNNNEQQYATTSIGEDNNNNNNINEPENDLFLSGARIPAKQLFESVAVGGTFDGLHFGHRKLLTLAVSSVHPLTGRLMIGVTSNEMLTHKQFADQIPSVEERIQLVYGFLHRLAPGMLNRIKIMPIRDSFGPPGHGDMHFDALILSHETLDTGYLLNRHRVQHLGLKPLTLLCTRRTEAHGMSSTVLRRMKSQRKKQQQQQQRLG